MDGRTTVPRRGPEVSEREYAIAARDRHDESYDMVRAVRSARYKYIRNYHPEKAPLGWVAYRSDGASMQELLRLHAADELESQQTDLLEGGRSAEEIYDLHEDPHELTNLVADPGHRDVLLEHRDVLADWRRRTNDLGKESEHETVERFHGADFSETGEIQETAPPAFVPNGAHNREQRPVVGEVTVTDPATLLLHSSTQGAGHRLPYRGAKTRHARRGASSLGSLRRSVASRSGDVDRLGEGGALGFRESDTRQLTLAVEP